MKIISALFLFAAAAIAVYFNKLITQFVISKINAYKSGIKSIVRSGMTGIKTAAIIRLEAATFLVTLCLVILTGQWILMFLAVLVMLVLPAFYAAYEKKKYFALYQAGLTGFLEGVISGLKAGMSVIKTFQQVSGRDKTPVGNEISQVLKKIELGISLSDALAELAEKIPLKDNEIIIAAINTSLETGGNITEVLSGILETIRKRQELGREVKSLTSQGVLSGIIVGSLPVFMILIISFIDPAYMAPMFNTGLGLAALAAAVAMEITGAVIIAKIVDVK